MAANGGKKEGGGVFQPEDILPELREVLAKAKGNGGPPEGPYTPEAEAILNEYKRKARVQHQARKRGDDRR